MDHPQSPCPLSSPPYSPYPPPPPAVYLPPSPPPADPLDVDEFPLATHPKIWTALQFIELVKAATLTSQFDPEDLANFLNPQEHDSTPPDDPNLRLSLLNFISLIGSSQDTYKAVHQNTQQTLPGIDLLSFYRAERCTQTLTGVVSWEHHMCTNSCIGFTGPYMHLESCPHCGEPCYNQKELTESDGLRKVPRKVFTTFPIGPQLQAHWKHPQTARDMFYQWEKTEELLNEHMATGESPGLYDDILCGDTYLGLVDDGKLNKHDSVLMLSIDGVQLYKSKVSDVWIYIWILLDLVPEKYYKIRTISGGIIPGPDAPGDLDSFLFPGLSHLFALQKEGLPIWDAHH